ncbi:MAG: hypothetical protein WBL45_12950 [Solirubrobacterales bacterium]
MQGLRNRLTYANVMSTIAVFLVLGGATAVAASKLGKNTVGTKQLKANSVTAAKLKKNAVTEKKVKNGAITTAKIKDGAITAAKLQSGTLGTAPSANFSSYNRRGIVRVAASPAGPDFATSRAASPEVPLVSVGAFSVYGKCFESGGVVNAATFIRTSENGSIFNSDGRELQGNPNFLNTNTPEGDREVVAESAGTNAASYFGVHSPEFTAMAPGGTAVRGDVQVGVKNGTLASGNGVYGNGNVCLFAGEITALNG